ncbi:MAG: DUF692 domain-containing protein [Acidobacteria bacterium]|nr:DUF692 domain-containing protein [Acidobacteriota bacterium]
MAVTLTSHHRMPHAAGIGLRLPHLAEVTATLPAVGWLEIHPENFLANPHAAELLIELSHHYPISVHTVGISIGSVEGIDKAHLTRLRALVDAVEPVLVSGHLAWSTHEGAYLNDLLPLPYDEATLRLLAEHLDRVQDGLGRPYIVENPSSYVALATSTMTELEFLNELVHRTGCQLLCDVSNVYLSGHNMGYDPYPFIDGLPAGAIAELHLGGFTPEEDEASPGSEQQLYVDTHATPITEPVWALYAHALRRFGSAPTIIEWDSDIPALATLLGEVARADAVGAEVRQEPQQQHHAHAH